MSERSLLFRREPSWSGVSQGASASVSIRSWLFESGSLTARLRAGCGPGFGVKLIRQGWYRPYAGESRVLGLPPQRRALVREVALQCDGHLLVLARSVIPPEALRGVQCRLAHLGERPLGELLFAYRKLSRVSLEVAKVPRSLWRAKGDAAVAVDEPVWGRRSLYAVARGHILVCEFFLPTVSQLSGSRV